MVRLAGLYHAQRGAHTFFLRKGQVERWGGTRVNLIHYEDGAALCCAVSHLNPSLDLRLETLVDLQFCAQQVPLYVLKGT